MAENSSQSPNPIQTNNPLIEPTNRPQLQASVAVIATPSLSSNLLKPSPSTTPSIDLPPQIPLTPSQQQQIQQLHHQQQQSLQRSPSMLRQSQMQQQQFGMTRQQAGSYVQMNSGGNALQQKQQIPQQQQQQMGQMSQMWEFILSRSALMGQTGHIPMLSGQAADAASAAQFNLQSQFAVFGTAWPL